MIIALGIWFAVSCIAAPAVGAWIAANAANGPLKSDLVNGGEHFFHKKQITPGGS